MADTFSIPSDCPPRATFPLDHPFAGLTRNHYGCIIADPPWKYANRTNLTPVNWHSRRDAEKHYDTMSLADIAAMPVSELAAKDAHLFFWVTGPFLLEAKSIIDSWGFRYSGSGFVWIKLKKSHGKTLRLISTADIEREFFMGLGHTTRKNVEFCLLGRRGNPKRLAKDVMEVMISPLRQHSRKPDEQYPRIERYCHGPRLELFARESREGWETWGHQRTKFDDMLADAA